MNMTERRRLAGDADSLAKSWTRGLLAARRHGYLPLDLVPLRDEQCGTGIRIAMDRRNDPAVVRAWHAQFIVKAGEMGFLKIEDVEAEAANARQEWVAPYVRVMRQVAASTRIFNQERMLFNEGI